MFSYFLTRFRMTFRDKPRGRADLTGGAIAALKGVMFYKCVLKRMKVPVRAQPFDSGDISAFLAHGKQQTGIHPNAINQNSAGTALTVIATLFSAGKTGMLS